MNEKKAVLKQLKTLKVSSKALIVCALLSFQTLGSDSVQAAVIPAVTAARALQAAQTTRPKSGPLGVHLKLLGKEIAALRKFVQPSADSNLLCSITHPSKPMNCALKIGSKVNWDLDIQDGIELEYNRLEPEESTAVRVKIRGESAQQMFDRLTYGKMARSWRFAGNEIFGENQNRIADQIFCRQLFADGYTSDMPDSASDFQCELYIGRDGKIIDPQRGNDEVHSLFPLPKQKRS